MYCHQGSWEEGLKLLETSVTKTGKWLGFENPISLEARLGLGDAYRVLGWLDEAATVLEGTL
jgi:hypothetical protein